MSPISEISKDALTKIVLESKHFYQILDKLGLVKTGYYHRCLKQRLERDKINCEHIYQKDHSYLTKSNRKTKEQIFVEHSTFNGSHLLDVILRNNIYENRCYSCGIGSEWNGKRLRLEVHHVNGIKNDNRVENLMVICPNCHSQTDNFSGKTKKDVLAKKYSKEFLYDLVRDNTATDMCKILNVNFAMLKKILKKHQITYDFRQNATKALQRSGFVYKRFEINREELEKLVNEKSYEEIGRTYNVSGNAIKKRCKMLGIKLEPRISRA